MDWDAIEGKLEELAKSGDEEAGRLLKDMRTYRKTTAERRSRTNTTTMRLESTSKQAFKTYAAENRLKLKNIYIDAFGVFRKKREKLAKSGKAYPYRAMPNRDLVTVSINVTDGAMLEFMQSVADEDGMKMRTVLYSCMHDYFELKGIE